MFGGGRPVQMDQIGLGSTFENNWVTKDALVQIKVKLRYELKKSKGSPFSLSGRELLYLQGRNSEQGQQDISNPLFSLGSGNLIYDASCSGSSCNVNFSYSDSFGDPLSFDHWSPIGPVDIGRPYDINHSFEQSYSF